MKIYRGERLNNPTCLGEFPVCAGSKRVRRLGGDDYITLKFSSPLPIRFLRGDWIYDERFGGLFSILKNTSCRWTSSKGCYDYELRFEKDYKIWGGVKFMLAYEVPENNQQVLKRNEISWKYTASLKTHLEMLLTNLHVCGFSFMGENSTSEYDFYIDWLKEEYYYELNPDGSKNGVLNPNQYKIDSYIKWDGSTAVKDCGYDTEAFYMEYNNISILSALDSMAKKFDAEWWVEGNTIHIGRCEKEHEQSLEDVFSAQEIRIGGVDNVVLNCSDISSQESTGSDATRFYFYGGTQNVPSSYGKHVYAKVVETIDQNSGYTSYREGSTGRWIQVKTKWLKLQQIGDKKIDAEWFNSFQNMQFRKNMYFSTYIKLQEGADWFTTIGYEKQPNVEFNAYRLRQDIEELIELPGTEGSPFFTGLYNDTPSAIIMKFEHEGDFIRAEKITSAGSRAEYAPEGTFNLGIRYTTGESSIASGVSLEGLKAAIGGYQSVGDADKISYLHYNYTPSNDEKTFIASGGSIRIFGNFDAFIRSGNNKAMPVFQVCGKSDVQEVTNPAAIQGVLFSGNYNADDYDRDHYGAFSSISGDTWLCCRREFCPSQGESEDYKVCDINVGDTIEFNDGFWNTDIYTAFPPKDLDEYKAPLAYFSYPLGLRDFVYNLAEPRIHPYGFKYLDIEDNISGRQVTEDVKIFDDIFPEMYDHKIILLSPDNSFREDSAIIDKLIKLDEDLYGEKTKYKVEKELADGSPEEVGTFPLISIVDTDQLFNFEASWMLDKADKLKIHFNSGLCMGMEFEASLRHEYVIYQNGKARELTPEEKQDPEGSGAVKVPIFQIAVNENYGTYVPNSTIYPKSGDKYTLLGWDVAKMGETSMVENAERRLAYKAQRFMELRKGVSGVTFTATLLNSFAKGIAGGLPANFTNLDAKDKTLETKNHNSILVNNYKDTFKFWEIGDIVYLYHPAYVSGIPTTFQQLLKTRIIGYEFNLDYPFDNAKFIIGTETELSRIRRLEKLL